MNVTREQVKRVSRIGLIVALGALLPGILAASLNASKTRTIAGRAAASRTGKPVNAAVNTSMPIQAPVCVAPPSGMISWWAGDGNADDIQDGNNGTLVNGTTFAPGMVAQAFSLDGVNDFVEVPDADNLDLPSQITIDAWIKPTVLGGHIVDKISIGGSDGYLLDIVGGKLRFVFGSGEVIGATTLSTTAFTHVTGTYDFTDLTVYVNGAVDGTLSAEEVAVSPNSLPLRIGADQGGASTFTGLIDEVEIFDRALSQPEIQSIVDAGSAGKCKNTCSITCPADISQDNDIGQCGAMVSFAPTASACGTVTCVPPSGSFFSVGSHPVNCTTSACPSCTFNITVRDTEPPAMACGDLTKSTDPNVCTAVVDYPSNLATDNCPGVGLVCTPPSHSTFMKGTTPVTCTATDAANNTAMCTFDVTVKDTQPPNLAPCPANISAVTLGACQIVTYTPPTATDNCGVATVNCAPPSGSCFAVGTTTVTCTASDSSPDSPDAMCSFTITVANCALTCPNITVGTSPNQCGATVPYNVTSPAACGAVMCSPASGSFFPKGTTSVVCSTSGGGNCSFSVTVNDTQPPVITCPGSVNTAASTSCPPTATAGTGNFTVTASDNCPGVTTVCKNQNNQVVTPGSSFPVGTTTVTCTATDTSGNTAACSFAVTVFSGCVQDESDPSKVVLYNAQTGQYRFCCGGTTYTGTGTLTVRGCVVTITHNTTDRRVQINTDGNTGNASLQSPPGAIKCSITDRNVRNNSCACQ